MTFHCWLQEDTDSVHDDKERKLEELNRPTTSKETFRTPNGESRPKRKQVVSDNTGFKTVEQCMNETHNYLKTIAEKPRPDQSSLYADLLATKLRALDDTTRQYAMLYIDNFLFTLSTQNITTRPSLQLDVSNHSGIPPLPRPFPTISNFQSNTTDNLFHPNHSPSRFPSGSASYNSSNTHTPIFSPYLHDASNASLVSKCESDRSEFPTQIQQNTNSNVLSN